MKERGESLVLCLLLLVALTGVFFLCSLELKRNFSLLEKRTHLFLCTKEIKGEMKNYVKFMGKTNWAIKNLNNVKLITLFIPGLQGVSANADKVKKAIQAYQNYKLVSHLKLLKKFNDKSCPLDPQLLLTPYELAINGFVRDNQGAAITRKNKWSYYHFLKPYLLKMELNMEGVENPSPRVQIQVTESMGKLSSHWSSPW